MPSRVKKIGNQHNSRHENGVVAPGKRVNKQRSNGHLSGSADGTSQANGSLSSAVHNTTRLPDKRSVGGLTNAHDNSQGVQEPGNTQLHARSKDAGTLANGDSHGNGSLEYTHRKIDVNVARNPMVHANGIWQSTLTVLRSCPLGDTITILIVLLSLPPTILTVTNALFAVLTFITPTGPASLPTTFHEIFQGSGGTPSLATIVLTDVIGLWLWLVLWTPMQALSIELAQAMVATQLGGGNASSKKKGSDRTILCMGIVSASHVARCKWVPKRLFGYDWPAILSSIPYVSKAPPTVSGYDSVPTRSPAGWIRILIALHILIQGLVHVTRRWYQKREHTQAVSISKKKKFETMAGPTSRPAVLASIDHNTQSNSSSHDATPKLSPTLPKDARDKISGGKKKRKQGTYVRSQQPLWAAFAHTKITFLREYEQSQAHTEASESNATNARNLGSAPFLSDECRVWISKVLPTSFRFEASKLPALRTLEPDSEESTLNCIAATDCLKPLYVRINDTDWTSMRIESATEAVEAENGGWSGEVFGLSPSSSYKCSFVQSGDGEVIYSTILTTPTPFTDDDGPATASVMLPHRVHRPSSPTTPSTTLKNSITVFENSLTESHIRQKRYRKDNKAASTALKKEIEGLTSKIVKIGIEEKQHHTRHWQWNQNTKQADEAVDTISNEIELIDKLPEDDLELFKKTRTAWDEMRERQSAAHEALSTTKDDAYRARCSVQNESTTAQQKRDRLLARTAKLSDQHEKLESSMSQGLDENQRKNSEQAAKDLERVQYEQRQREQLAYCQRTLQENNLHIGQARQQVLLLEQAMSEKQILDRSLAERPLTPEGDLPGTVSYNTAAPSSRHLAFAPPDPPHGLRSHSGSLRRSDHRPRSISLLTGGSGYADFDDDDLAPPMPTRAIEMIRERGRKQSGGSGSGSSGSQRDPASPVVGSLVSPVGKRSPVWNP